MSFTKKTNWTGVNVQRTLDNYSYINFLSLISQLNDIDDNKPLDKNYYYLSTAGHGIDMYFIDDGIIVHPNYYDTYKNTKDERTITCDAISYENEIRDTKEDEKLSCVHDKYDYPDHGISVSSTGAGSLLGVVKKANIHMIATDFSSISALRNIDYVIRNAKPYKIVFSISFCSLGENCKSCDDKLSMLELLFLFL